MASQFRAISLLGVSQSVKLRKSKQLNEDTIRGHYATQVLIALINSGFMDELESGEAVSVSSFAAREDLDAVVLQALCDYAYELEYLNQNRLHTQRQGQTGRSGAERRLVVRVCLR